MKILADTAIRSLVVAGSASMVSSALGGSFSLGEALDDTLWVGISLFLGLLTFRGVGPVRKRRFDRALIPLLYAWLYAPVVKELWNLLMGRGFSLQQLFWGWLQVQPPFVLSFAALFLLSFVWKAQKATPAA